MRSYNFLSQLLPWTNAEWERLAIFLTYLTPQLPSPAPEEIDRNILDAIDLDSYRAEVKAMIALELADVPGIVDPANPMGGSGRPEAEYDVLSAIVRSFNDIFADADLSDADRVARQATGPMMDGLVENEQLRRITFDRALKDAVNAGWQDNWELFDKLDKDPQFQSAFGEHMFRLWAAKIGHLGQ